MQPQRKSSAFTLIELLVVIAIIVVLIGLVFPVLGFARKRAKVVETTAELGGLQTAIENYYQSFNAYPGPYPTISTTLGAIQTAPGAGNKLSGTQNLLLGLSYPIYLSPTYTLGGASPTDASGVAVQPADNNWINPWTNATIAVNPKSPTGPNDMGNIDAAQHYKHYDPFYSPPTKELSPATSSGPPATWPPSGISVPAIAGLAFLDFPTIIDRFGDPLPILYYRRMPGVAGTANTGGANWSQPLVAGSGPPIVGTNAAGASVGSYYYCENEEYTTANALVSPSGATFDQTKGELSQFATINMNDPGPLALAKLVSTQNPAPANSADARGGYVLISAGPDRIYGKVTATSQTDDIVIVGGH